MDAFENQLRRIVLKKLTDVAAVKAEQITSGVGIITIDQYRERVGYLHALRDMTIWFKQAEDELAAPER